jgi:hypothetical protein
LQCPCRCIYLLHTQCLISICIDMESKWLIHTGKQQTTDSVIDFQILNYNWFDFVYMHTYLFWYWTQMNRNSVNIFSDIKINCSIDIKQTRLCVWEWMIMSWRSQLTQLATSKMQQKIRANGRFKLFRPWLRAESRKFSFHEKSYRINMWLCIVINILISNFNQSEINYPWF